MTQARPSAANAVLSYSSKCLIRDLNGELSLNRRKLQEAASACQHHIPFTIKDYPQPSVKLTETHSEENYPYPQDYKCGVFENGKYAAEYTHPSTETSPKP